MPITAVINAYRDLFRNLHPFEATVADLVVRARVKRGYPDLATIVVDLKTLRASTSKIAKHYAALGAKANGVLQAKAILEEGKEALRKLYTGDAATRSVSDVHSADSLLTSALPADQSTLQDYGLASPSAYDRQHAVRMADSTMHDNLPADLHSNKLHLALNNLLALQKELRRIPIMELTTPSCVLVGCPNVGKSSIVRAISSGMPEVNDYPFTTRSVTIGHIVDTARDIRLQVMDTPGLLDRPVQQRNEMENLTFACLAHLPTAVVFVIDASGLSGDHHSSLDAQLAVRRALRMQFPRRPWLDVVSKADLVLPAAVLARMPEGYLHVSVQNGINIPELCHRIENMLLKDLSQLLKERGDNRS